MSRNLTKASIGRRLHPALRAPGMLMAITVGSLLVSASPVVAKTKAPVNRGLETARQPVVQRTDFVFDATPDGYNSLSRGERQRITDWFDAISLGYGDRVSIAGDGAYASRGVSGAVSELVGQYGLLITEGAPPTAGDAPAGAVRIIVSRSTASVPGCPDWSNRFEADIQGGLSYEYGCAVNGNLAAMMANPEDLVQGRQTHSNLRGGVASKAVNAFRNAAPSGGGGSTLK